MTPVRSRLFWTATILFFLSGVVGLGYELIWIRKAALVVGSSQMAMSTVLTAFFLGLGIGSYVVGNHLRTKRISPLVLYGLFEAGIGAFALVFPRLFDVLETAYGALYPVFDGWGAALFALRFVLLFALFLPPTILMGGTLPLLLDGLVEKDAAIGSRTSFLYGVNILGAVAGVLLTSYWAIPALGLNGTSVAGAACNLAIGAMALASFARLRPIHEEMERPSLDLFFPLAAFASGLLAIAYQIAWARYFSLFNTGTVYLTAILLAVYLLALAAGSFLLAPLLARRLQPLRILSVVEALVPLFALLCIEWWRLAEYRVSLQGELSPQGNPVPLPTLELDTMYPYFWRFVSETSDAVFFAPLFQVALAIFIPVTLIGVGLPSIIAAAAGRSAGLRSVSGRILFWNTLGSSAGGFLAGYAFLPLLGLHGTLFTLGLGSLALSAAAHRRCIRVETAAKPASGREKRRQRRAAKDTPAQKPARGRPWLVVPAIGLAATLAFTFLREDITSYTIRYHGYGRAPEMGYDPDNPAPRDRLEEPRFDVIEGPVTTSWLFEKPDSIRVGSGNVCLAVAYKTHLSSQAIQGHLPCLLYPGEGTPRDCLGLCLGSGQSFGALLLHPIRTLDVVDISPSIVKLSLHSFSPYNHGLDTDPRVKFFLDDGRHFVDRAPDDSYDVISMEPPPPTAEGIASLYSVEFYRQVSRVLRTGGVFMQWLPLYRVTPLDARGLIKTQAEVFPETFVVKAFADDFMILSYESPPRFSRKALRKRIETFMKERLVKNFRWSPQSRHPVASLEGVLSLVVMGPGDVHRMTAPRIYHDDTQILSYTSGDRWLLRRYEGPSLSTLSFSALHLTDFRDLADYVDPPLDAQLAADLNRERTATLSAFHVPAPDRLSSLEHDLAQSTDPARRARLSLALARAYDGVLAKEKAYSFVEKAAEILKDRPDLAGDDEKNAVRSIVRHALSAFQPVTKRWAERLAARFPRSPLAAALLQEWSVFTGREAERLKGYLWP